MTRGCGTGWPPRRSLLDASNRASLLWEWVATGLTRAVRHEVTRERSHELGLRLWGKFAGRGTDSQREPGPAVHQLLIDSGHDYQ